MATRKPSSKPASKPAAQPATPTPTTSPTPTNAPRIEAKPNAGPTIEEIRARAHEIFLARGNRPGDAMSDWLQAERELRAR